MKIQILTMRSIGRRSSIRALLTGILLLFCSQVVTASEVTLLPGVDIREATFEVGAWCRYLVVDEAEGLTDSSAFYIAVVGEVARGDDRTFYWVEFESGSWRAAQKDRDVVRILISEEIKRFEDGDSLSQFIEKVYLKKGIESVTEGDRRDFEQLSFTASGPEAGWKYGTSKVETPFGPMECEQKSLTVDESREIPSGRVTLTKVSTDSFEIWSSSQIPIFQLVKCTIDRLRETRTRPRIAGIPQPGPRLSRTTTILMAYGTDAAPLISIQD